MILDNCTPWESLMSFDNTGVSVDEDSPLANKKAMLMEDRKADLFLSVPTKSLIPKRPLHEEQTNKVITDEISKGTLKEQSELLRVLKYCKAEEVQIFQELNQLSMKEREIVLHDIHGVADTTQETERLIDDRLEAMAEAIEAYERACLNKCAYSMAKAKSLQYVQDRQRRILFLRAENMHAGEAAMRFVQFFEQKLFLFGPDKLCSDISLADLSPDDIEFLSHGSCQLLPTRDRAGRAVFVHLPVFLKVRANENMLRSMYYILMAALEDEETQKKGIVFVFARFGPARPVPDPELTQGSVDLFRALPIRICAWHYTTNDKLLSMLFPLVAQRFERHARIRIRCHYGSYIECSYKLMTFGVPVGEFPLTDDLQDVKRQKHQKWISTRRNLELKRKTNQLNQRGGTVTGTLLPSQSDILFGRGKPVQEHPGNLSLGVLVESLLSKYNQCKGKKQKMDLTQGVVLDIKKRGGRFVKQVDGVWVEVDDETARSKVSHTFRNKKMELTSEAGGTKRSRPV